MKVVPFQAWHLERLKIQEAQAHLGTVMDDPAYGPALAEAGPAFTGVHQERLIGCAGICEHWPGRAQAWALLSPCGPQSFVAVHRAVKRFLADNQTRRIETTVDAEFAEGHRWALLLGFEREGLMKAYGKDGRDAVLYARVTWAKR